MYAVLVFLAMLIFVWKYDPSHREMVDQNII